MFSRAKLEKDKCKKELEHLQDFMKEVMEEYVEHMEFIQVGIMFKFVKQSFIANMNGVQN